MSDPASPSHPEALPGAPKVRRGRGRRPTAEVHAEILTAAGDLLLTRGMAEFTIEGVADLAGVSKTTIYKSWSSKGALALAGYFHVVQATLAFPDTGDVTADLTAQLRAFIALLTQTPAGRAVAELIGEAQTDPELMVAFLDRYTDPRRRLAVEAMTLAITRGQLRPDIDPQVVVDQLWGACYHRLLIPSLPLTEDFADALVHNLTHGVTITDQPPL